MSQGDVAGKTFFGHPRGLATLFFTEMWERFSYYGMRALLVLFMTASVEKGGFGFEDGLAGSIYGLYTAGVYFAALLGGWIADRLIGQRKSVFYGGVIIAAGHFTMAIGTEASFYLGLVFIVIGTGLLKPNVSTIVGDLYEQGDARRDAGFSIFYMGINVGAALGPLACGYFAESESWGWHYGFGLAGVGMVLGLIQYKLTERHLGDCGVTPKSQEASEEGGGKTNTTLALILVGLAIAYVVILQLAGVVSLGSVEGFANATKHIILALTVAYFAFLFTAGGLNRGEIKRVILILVLFFGSVLFWSGFEQAGSSLNLFTKYFTDRSFGDQDIPVSWFQSINPIFIILLAPFFGAMWIHLARKNLEPSSPLKFAFGLIFLGLGFAVVAWAAKLAADEQVGPMWLVLTYLLHTTGELCLSPVGLSTITKLSPKRYVGQMMGIWFVGTALGNLMAGLLATDFDFSAIEKAETAQTTITASIEADKEAGKAPTLTPELVKKVDEKLVSQIDPAVRDGTDIVAFQTAIETVAKKEKDAAIEEMPGIFWSVVYTTIGAGLILLVVGGPLGKLAQGLDKSQPPSDSDPPEDKS